MQYHDKITLTFIRARNNNLVVDCSREFFTDISKYTFRKDFKVERARAVDIYDDIASERTFGHGKIRKHPLRSGVYARVFARIE